MKTINSFSDLYNAIQNDSIEFKDALEYIVTRESEAYSRGYNSAADLYAPLIFSDNTVS